MRPAVIAPNREQLQRLVAGTLDVFGAEVALVGQAAHQSGVFAPSTVAFAVDEDVLRVVHHARAAVQAHRFQHGATITGFKPDVGLGLGQVFPKGALQGQRLRQGTLQRLLGKGLQFGRNRTRLCHRFLLGIAVHLHLLILCRILRQAHQQLLSQFGTGGRTEAYRVGHAFAFGNPVMSIARRQVQHVARLQHKLFLRLKLRQHLERNAFLEGQVLLAADAPAAAAVGLQQKDVVAVEMRPYPATVSGVADHQIVQPRLWHKPELLHQLVHRIVVQINPLHQQRPLALAHCGQGAARKRAMAELPATLDLLHQARLHRFLGRQRKHLGTQHRWLEIGNGLAHQQRLFVPMAAHELGWRETTQQGQGLLDIHG